MTFLEYIEKLKKASKLAGNHFTIGMDYLGSPSRRKFVYLDELAFFDAVEIKYSLTEDSLFAGAAKDGITISIDYD